MILDVAAVPAKYRPFSGTAQALELPDRKLKISGGLIGIEEGRTAFGAVGARDVVVVVHKVVSCRGGIAGRDRGTADAGRDTGRRVSKCRWAERQIGRASCRERVCKDV